MRLCFNGAVCIEIFTIEFIECCCLVVKFKIHFVVGSHVFATHFTPLFLYF